MNGPAAPSERDLRTAIETFGQAWAEGDVETLRSMLSPTYTHNDAFGETLDREAWLAYAGKRVGRKTTVGFEDLRVRLIGDVAIVTGRNVLGGGGIVHASDRHDLTIAFLQVWRRDNGRWLREAFQATPVRNDPARFG